MTEYAIIHICVPTMLDDHDNDIEQNPRATTRERRRRGRVKMHTKAIDTEFSMPTPPWTRHAGKQKHVLVESTVFLLALRCSSLRARSS